MTTKTTSSQNWVYVQKFYSLGSSPIRVKNLSNSAMKVQFREITDKIVTLDPAICNDHSVNPYTEVWFKSVSGNSVTIDCGFGKCNRIFAFSEEADDEVIDGFTEENVDLETRVKIFQMVEDLRNGVCEDSSSGSFGNLETIL